MSSIAPGRTPTTEHQSSSATTVVAIFVGGTNGIGASTAREFTRNIANPTIYQVGRNAEAAKEIRDELQALNPQCKIRFIQSDLTLLKNVDEACKVIQAAESKVNVLFMTAGYLSMSGRDESEEGLDKKLNLNYYARMRFIERLMPQLTSAANAGEISRCVSVLAAGHEGKLDTADLSLKENFSMRACLTHASTMTSLTMSHLASLYQSTSFIHTDPGLVVNTGIYRGLGLVANKAAGVLSFLSRPFSISVEESGRRHLRIITDPPYGPKTEGKPGSYLLNCKNETTGNKSVLISDSQSDVAEQVWNHTLDVFEKVCNKGEKW